MSVFEQLLFVFHLSPNGLHRRRSETSSDEVFLIDVKKTSENPDCCLSDLGVLS